MKDEKTRQHCQKMLPFVYLLISLMILRFSRGV